jgi:metal-responsive CopG/Arc/MetJ family transcriptional regulator
MPTPHRRIQVTVDAQLAEALDSVDPHPPSRSRLIRDLALRGAAATRTERESQADSRAFLLSVVRGETHYDPSAAGDIHAEREASVE